MKKKIAVLFLVFSTVFISCDQDFNTIGADLVGDEHFDFDTHEVGLKAYSIRTNEVQTNNLPINPLGFYDNPYFGETNANFVTQLSMDTQQPSFGTNVQIENVTLYIPYFSTLKTTNSDGSREFTLDSIFGADKESKMKLSVYENGYYLNSFGGSNQDESAKYFSDMNNLIDAQKRGHNGSGDTGTIILNDSPNNAENDQFFFNKAEIIVYKTKFNTVSGILEYVDANNVPLLNQSDVSLRVVKERKAPGIYLTLNKAFFKKKILEASGSSLFNNIAFRQYFKGLYFKMEQVAGQKGAMAMLNFNNAKLNVNYSSIDSGQTVASSKTYLLNLGFNKINDVGNTVSLQDYNYTDTFLGNYNSGLSNPANTIGNPLFGQNEKLYLKGGKGSVVYIDIFGDDRENGDDGDADNDDGIEDDVTDASYNNGIPDELDLLKRKGWLINDAYLEFYIDQTAMGGANQVEAERLYLFDATNQRSLFDYVFDASVSSNSKYNKFIHGGIIQRDGTTKKGIKYKIRVTQHINNLINSTNVNINKNVRLGLCVTENISQTGLFYYKSPLDLNNTPTILDDDIKLFPVASILSQEGVVLHGTASTDAVKRLKLTIHYTKPN